MVLTSMVQRVSLRDRDSRPYRLVSKLIFPLSKRVIPSPSEVLLTPYHSDLEQQPVGWRWFQERKVDYLFSPAGLSVKVLKEGVWWRNKRATALLHHAQGNVVVDVAVQTRQSTDAENYPNRGFQFGGVMLRDPRSNAIFSRESYVFNAIGFRGQRLQVETKSTFDGYSDVNGYDWSSGDARLRIVREGKNFYFYAGDYQGSEWQQVDHVVRDDMPEVLELALIVYSYSKGEGWVDLTVNFNNLSVL